MGTASVTFIKSLYAVYSVQYTVSLFKDVVYSTVYPGSTAHNLWLLPHWKEEEEEDLSPWYPDTLGNRADKSVWPLYIPLVWAKKHLKPTNMIRLITKNAGVAENLRYICFIPTCLQNGLSFSYCSR